MNGMTIKERLTRLETLMMVLLGGTVINIGVTIL